MPHTCNVASRVNVGDQHELQSGIPRHSRVTWYNFPMSKNSPSKYALLEGLNPPQVEAVQADKGAYLIIAGAGSGKTTALTRRIAYLIRERDVHPTSVLAVTFTNKAAGEMRERVNALLDESYAWGAGPLIGTFHSICVRFLREHGGKLGYDTGFTILDAQDQKVLIKKIMKEMEVSTQQFAPRVILEGISRAKNSLITPREFMQQADSYYDEQLGAIYDRYQRRLQDDQAMDFDDLIRLAIELFMKCPEVLERYQKQYRYILVDEYQDTNHAQYKLIKLLAAGEGNIFAVGDDWQSIYGWRQADVRNILNFEKDYPSTQVIKLEQNYRSTQKVLDAAFGVIKENSARTDKAIWTEQKEGEQITIYEASSEAGEAAYIADAVSVAMTSGARYSDFVVLYRTNAQSRAVEEYFLKNAIPYRIVGGIRFYERKEVKDMMAYLQLIYNPSNILALERSISEPRRGIGAKTLEGWIRGARTAGVNFIDFAIAPEHQAAFGVAVPKGKQKAITTFATFIKNAAILAHEKPLTHLIAHIYENSGYSAALSDGTPEGEARHENVQEILSVAAKYDEMPDALLLFLEEVALASDTDKIAQETDMVHLMTLHSAKGLEFPTVFIVGLEEGILPHARALVSHSEMEEERRLMYVGITRAKAKVYLLYTRQRLLYGSIQANPPSRFLDDIPEDLVVREESEMNDYSYRNKPKRAQKYYDFEEDAEIIDLATGEKRIHKNLEGDSGLREKAVSVDYADGERVKHQEFGVGVVVASDSESISIVFKGRGLTKLAKEYANLSGV